MPKHRPFKPCLEVLEDRSLPSAATPSLQDQINQELNYLDKTSSYQVKMYADFALASMYTAKGAYDWLSDAPNIFKGAFDLAYDDSRAAYYAVQCGINYLLYQVDAIEKMAPNISSFLLPQNANAASPPAHPPASPPASPPPPPPVVVKVPLQGQLSGSVTSYGNQDNNNEVNRGTMVFDFGGSTFSALDTITNPNTPQRQIHIAGVLFLQQVTQDPVGIDNFGPATYPFSVDIPVSNIVPNFSIQVGTDAKLNFFPGSLGVNGFSGTWTFQEGPNDNSDFGNGTFSIHA